MYPKHHFFYGLIFSLILFLFFDEIGLKGSFIILASSILIDVDHYIYYVYKKKDLSLKNSYVWFVNQNKKFKKLPRKEQKKTYSGFCFLHGFETLLTLFLLGFFLHKIFFFIMFGVNFHFILDFIGMANPAARLERISSIYDYLNLKKLKFIENS